MFCSNCGKEVPDGAKFCMHCGASLTDQQHSVPKSINLSEGDTLVPAKCTNCGAELKVDPSLESAVCPYCNTTYLVKKAINNFNINVHGVVNVKEATINMGGLSADNLIKRAKEFELAGDYKSALNYYNKVLDIDVNNAAAKNGVLHASNGRNELASRLTKLETYFRVKEAEYRSMKDTSAYISYKHEPHIKEILWKTAVVGFLLFAIVSKVGNFHSGLLIIFWCLVSSAAYEYKKRYLLKEGIKKKEIYEVLLKELQDYYKNATDCLLPFEYSNPDIIREIILILNDGRADTLQDAINVMIEDNKKD